MKPVGEPPFALVLQECQQGVLGPASPVPQLAEAAAPAIPAIARLAHAARAAGVPVVHCLAASRPDGRGEPRNAPLYRMAARAPSRLLPDTPAVAVLPEIGHEERDFVVTRVSGISPLHDTGLETLLRRLGVRTVVVAGVSVNVAIPSLVIGAVDAGFDVLVPRDAVAGTPPDYADAVLDNTLRLLARVITADEVVAAWADPGTHGREEETS